MPRRCRVGGKQTEQVSSCSNFIRSAVGLIVVSGHGCLMGEQQVAEQLFEEYLSKFTSESVAEVPMSRKNEKKRCIPESHSASGYIC